MTLRVSNALQYAWERLLTPAGGALVTLATGFYVVLSVILGSITTQVSGGSSGANSVALVAPFGATFTPLVTLAVLLLVLLSAPVLWIITARGLAADRTDALPEEAYTRRIGVALLSLVGAGILSSILATVGFVMLIIPGIVITVSLSLSGILVAVEDDGPVDALQNSWEMAKGDRIELFVLLLIISIIVRLSSFVGNFISALIPVVGWLVAMVLFGSGWVFYAGTMVGAYQQLKGGDSGKYGVSSSRDGEGESSESTTV